MIALREREGEREKKCLDGEVGRRSRRRVASKETRTKDLKKKGEEKKR